MRWTRRWRRTNRYGRSRPWLPWSSPRLLSFQQRPPSKKRSPSAPARSPPARSGSEHLRLPPQVGPQPTHPVRQNISGHSEVCGDIGVSPAVYDSVLQQPGVVRGQILEEGVKSVRGIVHRGDLGEAGRHSWPGWFPRSTFLALQPLPALDIPGNTSKTNGKPRKDQKRPSSRAGTRSGEDGAFLGILAGREWGFIGARFAAGMWIYSHARFWGAPLATFLAPCFRDTRICGWKRSGAPSTRSAPASARLTRSAKTTLDGESRLWQVPQAVVV